MDRIYTKNSTGVAPDGAWLAGDINELQDAVAALEDLTQALQVGSVAIGESGLQLLRYGTGEARLSGALRTDSIIRALGGLYAGAFTSTQRDAIASGSRPYGLIILNTTANRLEWNAGSDATPDWEPLAVTANSVVDLLANIPSASGVADGTQFFATDQIANYIKYSSAWHRFGKQAGEVSICLAATADAGHILLSGQAWPSTSGIYADIYARYGNPASVPDMRQYVPVGYKSGDADFGTLLATGGEKTHTLLTTEMAAHAHPVNGSPALTGAPSLAGAPALTGAPGITDPGHVHPFTYRDYISGASSGTASGPGSTNGGTYSENTVSATTGITATKGTLAATIGSLVASIGSLVAGKGSLGTDNVGGGGAHNNLQPYCVVNFQAKL